MVTLHVGAGTFRNLRVEDMEAGRLHPEVYAVPQATVAKVAEVRARGGKVVAVGTTTTRTLESAARDGQLCAGTGSTDLFIQPGFRFQVVDRLLTNFHLPRSSLLMLVGAFAGRERVLASYAHAIGAGYRFYSYGDAMLVDPNPAPPTG
jgi:S-adenosylmethionine:tRNA ribosyltransferase-isomerase